MALSNTKRIINELSGLETESATIVPLECCYILKIKIDTTESLNTLAEKLLLTDPSPSSAYYSEGMLILIFPAAKEVLEGESNETSHQLNGNHNLIVSKYCFEVMNLLGKIVPVSIQIVHLLSKTKVFSYMSYIVFTNYQDTLVKLSGNKITSKELNFRTDNELKNLLLTKYHVDVDSVPVEVKYGVVLCVKRVKNKYNYTKMSELFDARDARKYTSFICG